jgi:hypothetical protein
MSTPRVMCWVALEARSRRTGRGAQVPPPGYREGRGLGGNACASGRVRGGQAAGTAVDDLVPAVAAHLRDCPACAEDYECLLVLARDQSDE